VEKAIVDIECCLGVDIETIKPSSVGTPPPAAEEPGRGPTTPKDQPQEHDHE